MTFPEANRAVRAMVEGIDAAMRTLIQHGDFSDAGKQQIESLRWFVGTAIEAADKHEP